MLNENCLNTWHHVVRQDGELVCLDCIVKEYPHLPDCNAENCWIIHDKENFVPLLNPDGDTNLQNLDLTNIQPIKKSGYGSSDIAGLNKFIERQNNFITKDSGERQEFSTGMVRDLQTDKPRYDLLDLPMLKRWAELMGRGAIKYGENNWRKAETEEELNRFAASLLRHTFQLLEGDRTEDHGAAIMFNVAGYEMVREKLGKKNEN